MKSKERPLGKTVIRFIWVLLLELGMIGKLSASNELGIGDRALLIVFIGVWAVVMFLGDTPSGGPPSDGGISDIELIP